MTERKQYNRSLSTQKHWNPLKKVFEVISIVLIIILAIKEPHFWVKDRFLSLNRISFDDKLFAWYLVGLEISNLNEIPQSSEQDWISTF